MTSKEWKLNFPHTHILTTIFRLSIISTLIPTDREGGLGRGTHVNPWLIHVNVWQKPLQYCKVISFQLIKINGKKIIPTDKLWYRHINEKYTETMKKLLNKRKISLRNESRNAGWQESTIFR